MPASSPVTSAVTICCARPRARFERGALLARHRDELGVARRGELGEPREFVRALAELRERLERAREQRAAARELHRLPVVRRDRDVLELRGDAVVLSALRGEDAAEVLRQELRFDRIGVGRVGRHGRIVSQNDSLAEKDNRPTKAGRLRKLESAYFFLLSKYLPANFFWKRSTRPRVSTKVF